jgi:hypothetical protein
MQAVSGARDVDKSPLRGNHDPQKPIGAGHEGRPRRWLWCSEGLQATPLVCPSVISESGRVCRVDQIRKTESDQMKTCYFFLATFLAAFLAVFFAAFFAAFLAMVVLLEHWHE